MSKLPHTCSDAVAPQAWYQSVAKLPNAGAHHSNLYMIAYPICERLLTLSYITLFLVPCLTTVMEEFYPAGLMTRASSSHWQALCWLLAPAASPSSASSPKRRRARSGDALRQWRQMRLLPLKLMQPFPLLQGLRHPLMG